MDMTPGPAPRTESDGSITIATGSALLRFVPDPGGWTYHRDGAEVRHVPGPATGQPSAAVRVPGGQTLCHLRQPLLLGAGFEGRFWFAWPLALAVSVDGREIDLVRPETRSAYFGALPDGQILPAVRVAAVDGPDPEALLDQPTAALGVRILNRSSIATTLRRFPVEGGLISLHRREGSLVAGEVTVTVLDDGLAESSTAPGEAPDGFECLVRGADADAAGQLDWLLDSTRGSVEYRP